MPGLVINGEEVQVPGLKIVNFLDDPRLALRMGKNMRLRGTRWIRAVGLHNTKNIPTVLLDGAGPSEDIGARLARFWSRNNVKPAGAHTAADWDGTIYCFCDLLRHAAFHACMWNEVSIGHEMFQDEHGKIYQRQVSATVALVEFLCRYLGIQRQIPTAGTAQIHRLSDTRGRRCGVDVVGVFGHCHQWYAGKANDPGEHIFLALEAAGFKTFAFNFGEDLTYWGHIQAALGLQVDGVPGNDTRDALQARGFEAGLYDFSINPDFESGADALKPPPEDGSGSIRS